MSDGRRVGIFGRIKSNLFKWWQLTILPVLRINNDNPRWLDKYKTNNQGDMPQQESADGSVQQVAANKEAVKAVEKDAVPASGQQVAGGDPLEVLNRIQNEKNYIYQQEIEKERSKREEQDRIASIMNANKVNVNAFIEAGKAAIEANQEKEEKTADLKDEEARRAHEIIDRLNREAAEDEAKKQAEIEEAMRQAK